MIYLEIHGRLGNQMFQFACAKAIAHAMGEDTIKIDFNHYIKESKMMTQSGWEDNLRYFNRGGVLEPLLMRVSILQRLLMGKEVY